MIERAPLVLLPGLICDAALWRHQLDTLGDVAEPIVVADLTRFDDIATAASTLLDELPESFSLAGLSMGGYVAFEIMRQAPGRVRRLALLDTTARADTPEQRERRQGSIEKAAQADFDMKAVTQMMLPLFIHADRQQDDPLLEAIFAMTARVGREAFGRNQALMMNRPDSLGDLAAITCPTLVLCGRQDALTPLPLHDEMAAAIPRASQVVVEESGHLSTMERPHAVSAVMRYWLNSD